MRTKILINCLWLFTLLAGFYMRAHSQDDTTTKRYTLNCSRIELGVPRIENKYQYLIADETWLTFSKTGAAIYTYQKGLCRKLSMLGKWKILAHGYKNGNTPDDTMYFIYVSRKDGNKIKKWVKSNL